MTDETTTTMDFDEFLAAAGDCGVYQITTFLLIGIMQFVAIDAFAINFLAASMDHWCLTPDMHTNASGLSNASTPSASFSRCYRYELMETGATNRSMSAVNTSRHVVLPCDDWTYDRSQFSSTIVSQWDLVCGRAWLVDLVSTVYMTGRLVACLIIQPVADRFGRKVAVLLFHGVKMCGCVLSIYAPSYELFTASRFVIALGSTAANLATFLIVSEVSGIKWRSVFGVGWNAMISVGTATMPALAYFIRDYQHLQAVYTWPQFALFAYAFILDESPRWLVATGKLDRATRILRKIARRNKRPLPSDLKLQPKPVGPSSSDRRCNQQDTTFML